MPPVMIGVGADLGKVRAARDSSTEFSEADFGTASAKRLPWSCVEASVQACPIKVRLTSDAALS